MLSIHFLNSIQITNYHFFLLTSFWKKPNCQMHCCRRKKRNSSVAYRRQVKILRNCPGAQFAMKTQLFDASDVMVIYFVRNAFGSVMMMRIFENIRANRIKSLQISKRIIFKSHKMYGRVVPFYISIITVIFLVKSDLQAI